MSFAVGYSGLFAPAHRRFVVGLLLVDTFIAFEQMSVATVLPAVLRHLGGVGLYGWAFSAFMLAELAAMISAGPLVDRLGSGLPIGAAGVAFTLGLVVDGTAPSMSVLVVGRVVQGLGAGIIVVAANAAVGRSLPEALRARAFALVATAWLLPSIAGPAIAGVVAQSLTWRWVFLGVVPAVVFGLIVAVPPLRRADGLLDLTRGSSAAARPVRRATWLALAFALGGGLTIQALNTRQPVVAVLLGLTGVALLVVAIRAVVPRASGASAHAQSGAMIVGGLTAAAFFGAEAFLPLTLTTLHARSLAEAGSVLTVAAVAWTFGSWLLVRLEHRYGPRLCCAVGSIAIAAGVLCVFALDWSMTPWWLGYVAWAVAPLGMGLIYPCTQLVVVAAAEGGPLGEPVASLQVIVTLGTALGAGFGGAALAWSTHLGHGRATGLRILDAVAVGAALLGLVGALRLPAGPFVDAERVEPAEDADLLDRPAGNMRA